MENLLTVDEAARALRLARGTLYRRIQTGHVRAVRLGDGPRGPLRIEQRELERYARSSPIGDSIAARAEELVARRGQDEGDAEAYAQALRDLSYETEVFADQVGHIVHAQVEDAHRRGYFATAAATGSDIVDVEKIVTEELARLGTPLPDEVAQLGPKGLGRAALRILKDKGVTEYDERGYRAAIRQAIKDAINPKRTI